MENNLLDLLKLDLGITHMLRDAYFLSLLESSRDQLKARGITLDTSVIDDKMLVVNYAAWTYRKRQTGEPLSPHLTQQIRNRVVKERAKDAKP
ncbi:hypothetical protein [Shouchella lonarensis]|uniref:Uncharacterized protein n=1 Tax=Shouchella lonarensis TaxID=1464122 RepID=A0A1G6IK15_9BACI|nr:hypothetical protein [Shouchella lonarensis]SDC06076.1 hypothetical protein SAMN05421737_10570 [Shouchella lonarensis]